MSLLRLEFAEAVEFVKFFGKGNKPRCKFKSPLYSSIAKCGRSLVWSRTSACHADDPGSNLGDRTTIFLGSSSVQSNNDFSETATSFFNGGSDGVCLNY
jgi:hypothetical protein